ncbi:MAG: peptidoglycan editing factor PgeF [Chitinophagales bacterium]
MNWIWREQRGIKTIRILEWEREGVLMAFSSRSGGVSQKPYDSLNLALHVGDQPDDVLANREILATSLGIKPKQVVCAEQVHGNQVALVGPGECGRGAFAYADALPGVDALVTDSTGVYLMEFFADCLPVFFFDPVSRVVALAHAGWKGTAGKVVQATVAAMQIKYCCQPRNLQVFIGPGVGTECYTVDQDRKNQVERVFTFTDNIFYSKGSGIYTWDLQLTNQMLLMECGVPEVNIGLCRLCTSCSPDIFFSYRAAGGQTGRMAAVLGIRE